MRISENFTLNVPIPYKIPGNFFYVDSVPAGSITVKFFRDGRQLPEDLSAVIAGWYAAPDGGFSDFEVTSTLTQAVAFYVARGRVGSNVFSGAVSVTSTVPAQSQPANTAKTVTNVSAQLLAANAARKSLFIQNKDAAGTIWLNFGAGAATQANGMQLLPGEEQEWESCIPTTAIQAIGDAASNANIVAVEG